MAVQGLSVSGLREAEVFVVSELAKVLCDYVLKIVEHRGNCLNFIGVNLLLVLHDRFFCRLS